MRPPTLHRSSPTGVAPTHGPPDPDEVRPALAVILAELRGLRDLLADRRKPLVTVEELARLVGRDPYTVRSWIKAGRLKAIRVAGTGPRGRLLVPREEVDRLIAAGLQPPVRRAAPDLGDANR